jgi:hypothetical protein
MLPGLEWDASKALLWRASNATSSNELLLDSFTSGFHLRMVAR